MPSKKLSRRIELNSLINGMRKYSVPIPIDLSSRIKKKIHQTESYHRHLGNPPSGGGPYTINVPTLCMYSIYDVIASRQPTAIEMAYLTPLLAITNATYDKDTGIIEYQDSTGTTLPSQFPRTNAAVALSNIMTNHLSREQISSAQSMLSFSSLKFKIRLLQYHENERIGVTFTFPTWKTSPLYFSTSLVAEQFNTKFDMAFGTYGDYGSICELNLFKSINKADYDRMRIPAGIIAGVDSARLDQMEKSQKIKILKKTICCPYCHKAVYGATTLECEHYLAWLAAYLCLDFTNPNIWSLILFFTCRHCNQNVTGKKLPKSYPRTEIANNIITHKNPGFDGKLAFAFGNIHTFTNSSFGSDTTPRVNHTAFYDSANPDSLRLKNVAMLLNTARELEACAATLPPEVMSRRKTILTFPKMTLNFNDVLTDMALSDYPFLRKKEHLIMSNSSNEYRKSFVIGRLYMMSFKDKLYFIELHKLYSKGNYYAGRKLSNIFHRIFTRQYTGGNDINTPFQFRPSLYGGSMIENNTEFIKNIIRVIKIIINKNKYLNNEYNDENISSTDILQDLISELYYIFLEINIREYVNIKAHIKYLNNEQYSQYDKLISPILQELITFLLNKNEVEEEENEVE